VTILSSRSLAAADRLVVPGVEEDNAGDGRGRCLGGCAGRDWWAWLKLVVVAGARSGPAATGGMVPARLWGERHGGGSRAASMRARGRVRGQIGRGGGGFRGGSGEAGKVFGARWRALMAVG
jgi:hypothetical protein